MKRVRVTSSPPRNPWPAAAYGTDGRRVRTWEDAVDFTLSVRRALDQAKYHEFLDAISRFDSIGLRGTVDRMKVLLREHPDLKRRLNMFLPPQYQLSLGDDDQPEEAP